MNKGAKPLQFGLAVEKLLKNEDSGLVHKPGAERAKS